MANNKKSVLLYCDIIHTVKELSNEEAGLLFKHYLEYINDLNPEPPDKLTKVVFEPIKQNLKRDLKKWELFVDKQSVNGKLGGRPSKDLETQKTQAFSDKPKKAVKVTVTDTVNVKDTVTVKEIIPKENEFLDFCESFLIEKYLSYEFSLKAKYESWVSNGWKDGNNSPIKNWKSKIKNTVPFLKPDHSIKLSPQQSLITEAEKARKLMGL